MGKWVAKSEYQKKINGRVSGKIRIFETYGGKIRIFETNGGKIEKIEKFN